MPDNPYRLTRQVVPEHYEIELEPDLEAFTFTGREVVAVTVREPVTAITLNAVDLIIDHALLRTDAGTLTATVDADVESQRITLHLEEEAAAGPAVLELEFTGVLNDQLHGFYRSTFTDVDGVPQTIATTQFEATDARRAFPCWDEPDLKAVFAISLVVPDHLLAVSNTRELHRRQVGDGRVRITFADTMRMSTYLVAFVVGPFEATEPVSVGGVPVRVVAPRGKLHLTAWALDCARFCLEYLRDYYGIPYPSDKVDHLAIPDFAFGAMENLGCITYRETALLVDPDVATSQELLRILDVIGHELAHMWFGDLVTMTWWDGIWLNEAFASFMEMKSTDARRPDWKRWLGFGAVERPWAFGVDALHSTRPVEFEVTSPDEAQEMFDALTYGKGSSVLRMIEQYLGEETFRRGVGAYLRAHAHGNTVTNDLWRALDTASGQPVGEIMDTWIRQGGFPQVEVRVVDDVIRLRQRRYLTIPDETDQTLWKIPVQVRGESGGRAFLQKMLMEGPDLDLPVEGPIDWVVANAGGHGFYRVAYSEPLHKALVEGLQRLDDLERFCLVDDAWAFVESGGLPAAAFLELASAYRTETEQAIWQAVLRGVGAISHHLVDADHRPTFRRVVSGLLEGTMNRLGWDPSPDETDLTRRLRGQVIGAMGRLADDEPVIGRAREVLARWLDERRGVDPDVAQAALFVTASHADAATYETLFDRYRAAPTPQDELKLMSALTMFDRPELVDRTVEAVLDGRIKTQDAAWVVSRILGGRETGGHAWRQVRRQWPALTARMPPATLRRLVEGLPALSDPATAADVQGFFAEHPMPAVAKGLTQNLERLRANSLLREREGPSVARFLDERSV